MSRKEKSRIDTSGGRGLGLNAFDGLPAAVPPSLAAASTAASSPAAALPPPASGGTRKNTASGAAGLAGLAGAHTAPLPVAASRNGLVEKQGGNSAGGESAGGGKRFSGRIDLRREKSGRGGKVVTTLGGEGLAALDAAGRQALLKQLKNRFGCGGRCEGAMLEVQGNLVEQLTPFLAQMGWRVVRSGG